MPLPTPVEREHIHTRQVFCQGFKRTDNLWDIEAELKDVRTYGVDNEYRGRIEAGEPVHNMRLRVTLDIEFTIHDIAAESEYVPAAVCKTVTDGMKKLVGLKIQKGWMKQVHERIGGPLGCTHLIELLGPIGTTAYQTMYREVEERGKQIPNRPKPRVIDTCVAWASDGEKVQRRWPEFYTGK